MVLSVYHCKFYPTECKQCVCVCVCVCVHHPQVWFREGIQPRVPEGSSWEEVGVPKEVAQLCAGPGDLLWALLWDGNLLVRMGLSLDSPTGTHRLDPSGLIPHVVSTQ